MKKKSLYKILRHYLKHRITGNLGKVIELDNKLICIVDKRKFNKHEFNTSIPCFGQNKKNEELVNVYNLNKPICYIFDGIKFEKNRVMIFGYNNCEVIIKNCEFDCGIWISVNGKCTLDNCCVNYWDVASFNATELIVSNTTMKSRFEYCSSNLAIEFGGNQKVSIINSNIGDYKEKTNVSIESVEEINVKNSKLIGQVVECKAKEVNADNNSSLDGKEKVIIEKDSNSKLQVNESLLDNKELGLSNTSTSKSELNTERERLIKTLKEIRTKSIIANQNLLLEYHETLKNTPICKILKR